VILITGAAGKTGRTIINNLVRNGVKARALIRSQNQADEFKGKIEVVIGDLRDPAALAHAIKGVTAIYYICPNMAPDEVEIGQNLLKIAKGYQVERFIYHSVLHPQVESMPHHWQKMRMEEAVFESGLEFSILQPSAYMQNVLQYWKSITEQGIYAVPYATTARISIVDLEDIAEVARIVLTQHGHQNAIYELAGPQPLSQDEVAQVISQVLNRPVAARALDRNAWSKNAEKSGTNDAQRITLLKMFEYYERHGLIGNPNILNYLLNRPAAMFKDFVERHVSTLSNPE
jgi:uncharacterized protein YbjT (DUF2867 family)